MNVSRSSLVSNRVRQFRKLLRARGDDPLLRHIAWSEILAPDARDLLRDCESQDPVAERLTRQTADCDPADASNRILLFDLQNGLPCDMLQKVDLASMYHSLEVRVPFLDHRLVAWCASLPPRFKLRGTTGKWILRHAAARFCPGLHLQRRKLGFNAPVGQWLNGSLASWADELVDSSRELAGDWPGDPAVLRGYLDQHRRGAADHSFRLWGLLWLLEWIRQTGATLSTECRTLTAPVQVPMTCT